MNWVDAAILTCLALGAIIGWMRGFIGMVLGIVGYVAALVLAIMGAGPVASWAEQQLGLAAPAQTAISKSLHLPAHMGAPIASSPSPEGLGEALSETGLSSALSSSAGSFISGLWREAGQEAASTLGSFLVQGLAHLVLVTLAFLIIFLVVRFAAWVVSRGLTSTLAKGALGSVNRSLGTLVGIAQYSLIAALIVGVVTVLGTFAPASGLSLAFSESRLAPTLLPAFFYLISLVGGIGV